MSRSELSTLRGEITAHLNEEEAALAHDAERLQATHAAQSERPRRFRVERDLNHARGRAGPPASRERRRQQLWRAKRRTGGVNTVALEGEEENKGVQPARRASASTSTRAHLQ